MNTIFSIARKELASFFSSPVAFIFLGVFLAASLFTFFWVETFFAANITEIRALFTWLPLLLIVLTAAVTMRQWAEERRAGTVELLLTAPVSPLVLVAGKFLACLALVGIALLLTLPLPFSISLLGDLDWGPVAGGYLATIFLAAAYIAIGLAVSVRSDNQIVALITTTLICAFFYLLGSDKLLSFVGNRGTELLQSLSTSARFAAITRGVIDLRDLYYSLSLTGVFLCLNVYWLEQLRWAGNPARPAHRRWRLAVGLLAANLLAANFWLAPVGFLRLDLTEGKIYSISEASRSYLRQIQEPLLIRGYFSAQTHPLLAPLVPRLRDLLAEYAVAGGSKVHVEWIDPAEHPELEQEAGQKYGIRPVPFQTASKYQTAVTNSYFDILIRYGDQFATLGFRDLIEVKAHSEEDVDVELRNPEYDITRAIRKVLHSYQSGGDLFSSLTSPVSFTGYLSPDKRLPKELAGLKKQLTELLAAMQKTAGERFSSQIIDPDAGDGAVARKISQEFGFRPMSASLFDQTGFWFYLTLSDGRQTLEVPLPEDFSQESLKRSLEAGLKRFASGFARSVALVLPKSEPAMSAMGMPPPPVDYQLVKQTLGEEHNVIETDLASGQVPPEADLLMVVAPRDLSEKQLFAIDQFVMQGGTVVLAASPYDISIGRGLSLHKQATGLEGWLNHHGLTLAGEMVLDSQHGAFPVPVQRNLGGFTVEETHMVDYPFFVDIRPDGMPSASSLTAGINQLTMHWASPVLIDKEKNKERKLLRLLESSPKSWVADEPSLQPDFRSYPGLGFAMRGEQSRQLLGVAVEGTFSSYFAGKPSPLLAVPAADEAAANPPGQPPPEKKEPQQIIARQIDSSPASARIILFASSTFISDTMLGISTSVLRTNYLAPLQLLANAVDWSLEDQGLLGIRGRSHFSRALLPLSKNMQVFWEYLNYGLACAGLFIVWLIRGRYRRRNRQRTQALLQLCTKKVN